MPEKETTPSEPLYEQLGFQSLEALNKAISEEEALRAGRESLLAFTRLTMAKYEPAEHHRRIVDALERVERGELTRLMIAMPPRHGKSELASVRFPAWYLGRNPDKSIISASYAQNLASDFGRKVRNLAQDEIFQQTFGVRVSQDSASKTEWHTEEGGSYIAAGIQGGITGKGAHVFIIDDPVKNREEAMSETIREKIWSEYTSTVYTRLAPGGAVILIMTRWHDDDLAGRILDRHGDNWEVLNLPAMDEDGEALWPERYPVEALLDIKSLMSPSEWGSLYMQEPVIDEGAIFREEWFHDFKFNQAPVFSRIIQCWDTAFKDGVDNDRSACVTFGISEAGIYILNVFAGRLQFPDLKRKAEELHKQFNPNVVVIEDKASGQSLIQELRRVKRYGLPPLPILGYKPDRNKIARAHGASPMVESGNVRVPREAPWYTDFIHELTRFPAAKHDDITDAFTMGMEYIHWALPAMKESENHLSSLALGRDIVKEPEGYLADTSQSEDDYAEYGNPFDHSGL